MDAADESNFNLVTVLLADDADVIRRTVKRFLELESSIRIVGEATNFKQAISMAETLRADVILLDLHMPDSDQFKPAFVKNRLSHCGARVLAISLSGDYQNDAECKVLAESFGAVALVDKSKFYEELIPAILSQKNRAIECSTQKTARN